MKRKWMVFISGLLATVSLLGLAGATQPAVAQQSQARSSIPFAPISIVDFGPVQTNAFFPGWTGISGDWIGYATQTVICGHCGYGVNTLNLYNAITGQKIMIRPAVERGQTTTEYRKSAENMQLNGGILTWTQPGKPAQGSGAQYTPGDHDCTLCYYDANTGQGGAWTGGSLPPVDPKGDWSVQVGAGPPPDNSSTITVTQQSTNKVVIREMMKDGWQVQNPVVGRDKIVFVQTKIGHSVPQLLQLQWLLQPDPAFQQVWARADQPVAAGKAARSWLWGPAPIVTAREQYVEGVGGTRLVQYYDKSRMEVNNPAADPDNPAYVTNGLLAVEMVSGEIQIGDLATVKATIPCTIPVAGDPRKDNPLTPSYSDFMGVATLHGENQETSRVGEKVDDSIDVNGATGKDTARANLSKYAAFVPETSHNVPDLFWKYLTGMKATYGFDWTFVLGYPITEAYWTKMRVSGEEMPVLVQIYQRRALTYVPDFPATWRIQQGNVGQHYLEWRTLNMMRRLLGP
ncbi:MAG TPA: hypothetical protein VGE45_02565 [Chloroflexia bacterium]|jgi:hypothetical protein